MLFQTKFTAAHRYPLSVSASRFLLSALLVAFAPDTAQAQYGYTPDIIVHPPGSTPGSSSDVLVMPGSVPYDDYDPMRKKNTPENKPQPLGKLIEAMDKAPPAKTGTAPIEQPPPAPEVKIDPGTETNLPTRADGTPLAPSPPNTAPIEQPPPPPDVKIEPGAVETQPARIDNMPLVPSQPTIGGVVPSPGGNGVITQPGLVEAPGVAPDHASEAIPLNRPPPPAVKPPPLPKLSPQDLRPVPKQ